MKLPAKTEKLALVGGYLAQMHSYAKGHGDPFLPTLLAQHRQALVKMDFSSALTESVKRISDYGAFGTGKLLEPAVVAVIAAFAAGELGFKKSLAKKVQSSAINFIGGVLAAGFVGYMGSPPVRADQSARTSNTRSDNTFIGVLA